MVNKSKNRNKALRRLMWEKGVKHKDVAAELGIHEKYFSKLLSLELPEWRKEQITQVIERLGNGRTKATVKEDTF